MIHPARHFAWCTVHVSQISRVTIYSLDVLLSQFETSTLFHIHFFFFSLIFILTLFYFTILYWFCNTLTWISHGCTWVPNPEPPSHCPPRTIPLGHPSAPAPSILYHASHLDWWFISYMILYMFQCHSPKSSHPLPLPQSPKDCSIHLCLFCCLAYRVITCQIIPEGYGVLNIWWEVLCEAML